ncbi:hypothetical protein Ahy_B10g101349 [Arachis hypogaea]|uniref:PB1-like domain-containing protein n=1 Tax=Arachis hypogaea TaxID=3818 RepID=A0A444WZD4_ARAHY|nr:hypothetical protein Ahy_B10g101349 [Arachis hypogaea]
MNNENDAVLIECPASHDSVSFCGQSRFKTLQTLTTFHNNYLYVWLQNVSSPSSHALSLSPCIRTTPSTGLRRLRMEGPPMIFVFHHGGLFKKNVEGDMVYEPDNTEVLMGVEGDTLDVFFVRGYYRELGYIEAGN